MAEKTKQKAEEPTQEQEAAAANDHEPEVTVVSETEESGISASHVDRDEVFEANKNAHRAEPDSDKIELLKEVSFEVTVELGRKAMVFNDILNLGKGSIIELDKLAEEPVDIYVNQSKIAQGEVVVVEDHFGVRISKLLEPQKRG